MTAVAAATADVDGDCRRRRRRQSQRRGVPARRLHRHHLQVVVIVVVIGGMRHRESTEPAVARRQALPVSTDRHRPRHVLLAGAPPSAIRAAVVVVSATTATAATTATSAGATVALVVARVASREPPLPLERRRDLPVVHGVRVPRPRLLQLVRVRRARRQSPREPTPRGPLAVGVRASIVTPPASTIVVVVVVVRRVVGRVAARVAPLPRERRLQLVAPPPRSLLRLLVLQPALLPLAVRPLPPRTQRLAAA